MWILLIMLLVWLGLLIVSGYFIGLYIFAKHDLFKISYTNGSVELNTNYYSKEELENFKKKLLELKEFNKM